MIEKVHFRAFKAYREIDLSLEPLTVLVGPNASGKTSILTGLSILAQVAGKSPSSVLVGELDPAQVCTRGLSATSLSLGASASAAGKPGAVWLHVEGHGRHGWEFKVKGAWNDSKDETGDVSFRLLGLPLAAELGPAAFARFDFNRLVLPSYSEKHVPDLEFDGYGLASVLAHLKLEHEETFREIESALREVVPSLEKIRPVRAELSETKAMPIQIGTQTSIMPLTVPVSGNALLFDMKGAKGVPAAAVGEGTILVLGLLTLLLRPNRPRLVLLDDIELALHPQAQAKLIGLIVDVQKRFPGLQVVATSHSPFILNLLKPEQVRLTALGPDGAAHCRRLTDHPDFPKWNALMSPGEFWSAVGEQWIVEGGDRGPQ